MSKLVIIIVIFLSVFLFQVTSQKIFSINTPPKIAFLKDIKTDLNVRIVGGQPVTPNSYPFVVALIIRTSGTSSFCGGTLLTTEWILTAAHCVDGGVSQIEADLGAHQLFSYTQKIPVSHIIIHRDWSRHAYRHDIALLKLRKNATLSNTVRPMNSINATINKNYTGQTGTMIGWGQTQNGSMATVLKSVDEPVMNNLECNTVYGVISDGHICVSGLGNKGVCSGDSGGPLIVNGTQVGIASFSKINCSAGYPSVFTRISSYSTWITTNMKANGCMEHFNKPFVMILIMLSLALSY